MKSIYGGDTVKKEPGRDNSQQMVIDTPQLFVKGNIMCWDGMMIQMSNISCISTMPLAQAVFPLASVALILIGCFVFKYSMLFALALLGGACAWIYIWYRTNEERKTNTILNIVMNSGHQLQFMVSNKKFLNQILKVLERIIIDGGVGNQRVSINIEGCQITGNAKVLNDVNLV